MTADVCLILEGTYPYVTGGVSSWTHDMIRAHPELTFHLMTLMAPGADLKPRYTVPENVTGQSTVFLQQIPQGGRFQRQHMAMLEALEDPLTALMTGGGVDDLRAVLNVLGPHREGLGDSVLLNSPAAWDLLVRMYERCQPDSSFLEYFWGWRALVGGLYSVLMCEMPAARVYHTVCTGYAGLFAARAHIETGRPVLLTEHGIYTNERRIEIAMADWLEERPAAEMSIERRGPDIRDLWVATFRADSRACYEASAKIITLYEGNQFLQVADGAPRDRLMVIPNGIDPNHFAGIERVKSARPTMALIGRVVPIKDIKCYIRAAAIVRELLPDIHALIMGPTDEDQTYYAECAEMVRYLGLENTIEFTGRVNLKDYMGKLDVVVLTSISEAQPLVILEASVFGIPTVATDVGACREMLLGSSTEDPPLGPGGVVTPLSNPSATAAGIVRLLTDPGFYSACGEAVKKRLERYYNKADLDRAYGEIYAHYREAA